MGNSETLTCIPYEYKSPISVRNMWEALKWVPGSSGMTGTQANQVVNMTYHQLDQSMLDYIGAPNIANWFTYGKWASREAGQGINDLSAAMSALVDLVPSRWYAAGLLGGPVGAEIATAVYVKNHVEQFEVLWDISTGGLDWDSMHHPTMAFQILKMLLTTIGIVLEKPEDFQSLAFKISLVTALLKGGVDVITELMKNLQQMVTSLIDGNQGIYRNMAPCTDIFLKAEAKDGTGVAAVAAWAASQDGKDPLDLWQNNSSDPQKFLAKAFQMYSDCRGLTYRINSPAEAANVATLTDKRKNMMQMANVLLGCQEQMCILQSPRVFTNPIMRKLVQGQSKEMMLHDPVGGIHRLIPLLPDGGDWTVFTERMGMQPGSAIAVNNPYEGGGGTYDPNYKAGTIYTYFWDNILQTELMTTTPWVNSDRYPKKPAI